MNRSLSNSGAVSLARLSDRDSFKPEWQPPFISKLAAEDRCHLNGLALVDEKPKYATAVAATDMAAAWRDHRQSGGIVIDIESNEIVAGGLSMPHSPRWHDGRLWLLNSGRGEFGFLENGSFESVASVPGYARGLAFAGDYAIVGVSKPRHEPTFAGLPLEELLESRNAKPRSGVYVINLKSGDIEHWLEFTESVEEIYDVVTLPGVRRPKALGFKTDEIRYVVTGEDSSTIWQGKK